MKNKIIIYLSALAVAIALCFGIFYYNFFGGPDHRMNEIEYKKSSKTFSVVNNTDSHLFMIWCFRYSEAEIEKYKKKGIDLLNFPEETCRDTVELKGRNDLGDNQFNEQVPFSKSDMVRVPEGFLITILDSNKVVLKSYDRQKFEDNLSDSAGGMNGWYLTIERIDGKIQLANKK